ncbi:hypothetical protein F443_21062 [Phytophthora nicotianae P1569]|uniref:Uncharacterized protein n=1 Tax=Phytophthora nicotianae P1569 TaxID=1317065 RepID=V9DYU1_PHYNI|nr:hypothetical protein F443_21062 [Phytophthora nicotianae P1569]
MDILQYFCKSDSYSNSVAKRGVDMGLKPRYIHWGGKDTANAASGGQRSIVRWLYQFDTEYDQFDNDTMKAVVARGDVELVQ